ncbi:MAG: hypothetical protein WBV06_12365 [Acidimicrobiia bacterium]
MARATTPVEPADGKVVGRSAILILIALAVLFTAITASAASAQSPGLVARGTVVDSDGTPLPDIRVIAYFVNSLSDGEEEWIPFAETTTRARGQFNILLDKGDVAVMDDLDGLTKIGFTAASADGAGSAIYATYFDSDDLRNGDWTLGTADPEPDASTAAHLNRTTALPGRGQGAELELVVTPDSSSSSVSADGLVATASIPDGSYCWNLYGWGLADWSLLWRNATATVTKADVRSGYAKTTQGTGVWTVSNQTSTKMEIGYKYGSSYGGSMGFSSQSTNSSSESITIGSSKNVSINQEMDYRFQVLYCQRKMSGGVVVEEHPTAYSRMYPTRWTGGTSLTATSRGNFASQYETKHAGDVTVTRNEVTTWSGGISIAGLSLRSQQTFNTTHSMVYRKNSGYTRQVLRGSNDYAIYANEAQQIGHSS